MSSSGSSGHPSLTFNDQLSVPMGNRSGPSDGDDVPPPQAQAPQARVYGRPAQPVEEDDDDPAPVSPFAPACGNWAGAMLRPSATNTPF